MLAFSVWMVLLTAALLVYPRRPRTAGMLIASMGVWTSWYMTAFWLAWGLIWIVRYNDADRRAAHLAYWTEKKI